MKTKTKKTENNKTVKNEKAEEKKEQETKAELDEKNKTLKKRGVRLFKCEYCQNIIPDRKKTLNFSCQHQLCGVCISHSIFRDYFKCISESSDLITLHCNECLKNRSLDPGFAQVPMSFILTVLKDTYKVRNKKQRDICLLHKMEADFCIECKRWICEECKKSFHKSNFPTHSVFTTEEPFSFKKCSKHGDKGLELFCENCQIEICPSCALKGAEHGTHNIISMVDLKKRILKGKKIYKFQKMDEFDDYLQKLQIDFKNRYEEYYRQKSELISDITTLLQTFYDKFFSFKEKMENYIENYFKIIRACYFNYFKDIEEKEPRMNSLEFINAINKEISHFDIESKYTEELETIKEQLQLIIPKKFFEYKLRFANYSFQCINVLKDKIEVKKEEKKEEKKEVKKKVKKGDKKEDKKDEKKPKKKKELPNQIYCLTQLKNGNILTGGSKGILDIWDLTTDKKVDSFKAHNGTIYSVLELEDGRFVSSSSDSWIKFWNFKSENDSEIEPRIVDIVPKKSIKQEPIKVEDQNQKINNNEQILTNTNMNNNISQINITNEVHIKIDNQNTLQSNPTFNQPQLFKSPPNTNIPGNENIDMNMGINSGMNMVNNPNPQIVNQPQIKEDHNAPDTGYGGGGIHHDMPRDVAYGSSGIAQNPPQNTQIIQDNNMNNFNSNNQNQNAGNEFQNQMQVNNNNNNAPWLENPGVNRNEVNPVVNNDSNNLNLSNNININNPNLNPNPQNGNEPNNNYQNSMFPNNNMNPMDNNNSNQNPFNNQPVNPIPQEQRPPEERKEEEKKEEEKKEEKKEEDEYNDFFEGEPPKANPPKRPDSLNEENNKKTIMEEKKPNYICKLKLHGHSDDVNCIFETNDKKLVSCGKDGFILIWTLDFEEKPIKIKGHENGVGCGIELKDNFIITGGGDGNIKIWDTRIDYNPEPDPKSYPKPDAILKGHKNAIFALCKINEKKLASASCDKSIRIWDLEFKKCLEIYEGHSGFIWSLVNVVKQNKDFNNKSKVESNVDNKEEIKNLLISASSDKTIRFWDIEEKRCIKSIYAHDKEITVLGKLNDGNIISGSLDSTIKVWKV